MKRKVCLLLLAIASMYVIPVPTEAQVIEKATKAVDGFLDTINKVTKKKKSGEKTIKGDIYINVDENPQYPGGENALSDYLSTNMVYPIDAEEEGIEGEVIVSLVVLKNGEVTNCNIEKSDNSILNQEALRLIKSMPNWIPGKLKGKNVNTKCSVPIIFKITPKESPLTVYKTMSLPPIDDLELIIVDKGIVNLREKPNGAQRRSWDSPITLDGWGLFGAKIYPSGWAFLPKMKHPEGFISPKVFHKAINNPFEEWMFNTAETYMKRSDGRDISWRLGIHIETGLVLEDIDYLDYGNERTHYLKIGRIDNNVYYPLNSAFFSYQYDPSITSISLNTTVSQIGGAKYYSLVFGKANAINTNRGIRINLENIPTKYLEEMFLPVPEYYNNGYMKLEIPTKESDVIALYSGLDYFEECINAELMSSPYIDESAAKYAYENRGTIPDIKTKHMKFLGYELGGDAKALEKALRNKGFTDGSGFGMDDIYLKGNVYGKISQLRIEVKDGKAKGVYVIDTADSDAEAKKRCNDYKQHLVADFGKGKSPYADKYVIDLPYGTAYYESGMFDSGMYELMMYIGEK